MMDTPNIRCKGYTGSWEQRKCPEILKSVKGAMKIGPFGSALKKEFYTEAGVKVYAQENIFQEDFTIGDYYISEERYQTLKGCKLEPGDLVISMMGTIGACAIFPNDADPGIMNSHLLRLQLNDDIYPEYIHQLLRDSQIIRSQIDRLSVGSIMNGLSSTVVQKLVFPIPSLDEQKKIAKFLIQMDKTITLHQRKCDEISELKKNMLQKMFPKNGEQFPEIRFSGFTAPWEQRKIDDWGTFYYGRSCPKWSVTEDATIPCIRYGELYTKFGAKIDRVYSYTNISPENLRFSKGTEVLIPRVGEDPMDYNHCTWLSIPGVAIGEMISVYNTEQNPLFTAIMFNATLQAEFAIRVEGGSVTNLYFEKLKNIDVSFPSIEEQEKIAEYFSALDSLITLHHRKCDDLKEIKKYMLQNMFPKKG